MQHEPRGDDAPPHERRIVWLLAFVQFVNILDFMLPSPLGPQFAADLGIPTSDLGVVVSSYTLAAGVAGFVGAFVLDRFDRRTALAVSLTGLAVGTAGAIVAYDLPSLVVARVIAGLFGGPATSLALAVVADVVPTQRRGRALGTVMLAFSLSSVLGVPVGLTLAGWGGWHTPFVVTGLLGLCAAVCARLLLPPLRKHLEAPLDGTSRAPTDARTAIRTLLTDSIVLRTYLMTITSSFGAFVLVPNIASFVQNNLHFPQHLMPVLYGAGGVASFLVLRPYGRLVDRLGAFPVALAGSVGYALVVWGGFIEAPALVEAIEGRYPPATSSVLGFAPSWLPILATFVLFMVTSNARNVAFNTLTSRVPPPALRARFQSFQSMVQHLGLSLGGFVAPLLLTSDEHGALHGIDRVSLISITVLAVIVPMLRAIEQRVNDRDREERARREAVVAVLEPAAAR